MMNKDDQKEIIRHTEAFVRETLAGAEGGHDWWHVHRVRTLARRIAAEEGVDLFVVELAALLHDIGKLGVSDIIFARTAPLTDDEFEAVKEHPVRGEAVLRAGGPGSETSPHWSPDGKYLAYVSSSEPGTPVLLIPPHGGSPRRLVSTNMRTLDLDKIGSAMGDRPWSVDSKTLLVSRVDELGRTAIYRVDCDNGDAEQMTFPPPGSLDFSA